PAHLLAVTGVRVGAGRALGLRLEAAAARRRVAEIVGARVVVVTRKRGSGLALARLAGFEPVAGVAVGARRVVRHGAVRAAIVGAAVRRARVVVIAVGGRTLGALPRLARLEAVARISVAAGAVVRRWLAGASRLRVTGVVRARIAVTAGERSAARADAVL